MISFLSRILFPHQCLICKQMTGNKTLCESCESRIPFLTSPHCDICGRPFLANQPQSGAEGEAPSRLDRLEGATRAPLHRCGQCLLSKTELIHRSAVIYDGPIVSLIYRLKYGADFTTLNLFALWIQNQWGSMIEEADYLIPVPLSSKKLSQRGFNQSLELAKILARKREKKILIHSLKKIRDTKAQTQLSQSERRDNLRGAFTWSDSQSIKNEKVLLIDDVHSTGSTLEACADILSQQKPSQIQALTIAYNSGRILG